MAFTGVAIKSVPYWIAHLQCCVLITHGAVVKVQGGCNVHDGKPALVCRESASVVSTYLTVVDGSCIMKTPGEENPWLMEAYRHRGSHVLGSTQ